MAGYVAARKIREQRRQAADLEEQQAETAALRYGPCSRCGTARLLGVAVPVSYASRHPNIRSGRLR